MIKLTIHLTITAAIIVLINRFQWCGQTLCFAVTSCHMMLWTTNARLLPRLTRSRSITLSSTVLVQGMTTSRCHITVLLYQATDRLLNVKPLITTTIRDHHTTAHRLSLILRIAWQLTTHIKATIMCVHRATTQSRHAKLLPMITTIWIISAPLSMKMPNTATCTEDTTISRLHIAPCFMTQLRRARPQERTTICLCFHFVRVNPTLKNTTALSIANILTHSILTKSLTVQNSPASLGQEL
jgi:hypothetical protein